MPRTSSLAPARPCTTLILIAIGAALCILFTVGFTASAQAFAQAARSAAVADARTAAADTAVADLSLAAARTALTDTETLAADVQTAALDLGAESTAVDTSALVDALARLDTEDSRSSLLRPVRIAHLSEQTQLVSEQNAALRARLDAAVAQKTADDAAAAAAAGAAAQAAAANTPDGAKASARQIAADEYGWGDGEFSCLSSLWEKESGWNYQA